MKAVICFFSFPPPIFDGVRAITTSSSAFVPFVHQSFSPFRIQPSPSALGIAVVSIAAGSDPTPCYVSANAENAPFARRGEECFLFASIADHLHCARTPLDPIDQESARGAAAL